MEHAEDNTVAELFARSDQLIQMSRQVTASFASQLVQMRELLTLSDAALAYTVRVYKARSERPWSDE